MNRLQYFLSIDDMARQKTALIAAASGFVFGLILQWSGEPFDVSAYSAVVLIFGVFTLRVWFYCRGKRKPLARSTLSVRSLFKLAVAGTVMFFLSVIPAPKVEAGAVDHSLRALTRGQVLSSEEAEKLGNTLELAQRWHVALRPPTLIRVRDCIQLAAAKAQTLDGLPKAANALAVYDQHAKSSRSPDSAAAAAEYDEAVRLFAEGSPYDPVRVNAIVQTLTHAIRLSQTDRKVQSDALLMRAFLYSITNRWDDALVDARSAEALGALDLYPVFLIEGVSLSAHIDQPDDLRQAVRLLKLVSSMPPRADHPMAKVEALTALAETNYKLGDLTESREAAQQALPLVPRSLLGAVYQLISLSYLQSGAYEQALTTSQEYASKVGDPKSASWLKLMEGYPRDPESNLAFLELYREHLGPK